MFRIPSALGVVLLSLGPAVGQAPTPRYALDVQVKHKVSGTVSFEVACPTIQAAEWMFFATQAPELTGQTGMKTELNPKGTTGREQSLLARPVAAVRIPVRAPAQRTGAAVEVTYSGTLRTVQLKTVDESAKLPLVPALTAQERQHFLADFGDMNHSQAAFKKWLTEQKLQRDPKETEIDFARRTLQAIRQGFTYVYEPNLDRQATAVCKAGKSDCGGLSILFVSILRANKIPARCLFGRWAKSAKPGEKLGETAYFEWHVKGEFYADKVGWVPVEVSAAVTNDKSDDLRNTFGVFHGDFITFHLDPNLILPVGNGLKVHNVQLPAWYVNGRGDTSGAKTKEDWKVTVQEAVK